MEEQKYPRKKYRTKFLFFSFFILSFCARTKPPFGEWWVSYFYFRSSQNLPPYHEFHPRGLIGHILVLSISLEELENGKWTLLWHWEDTWVFSRVYTYTYSIQCRKNQKDERKKNHYFFFWKSKVDLLLIDTKRSIEPINGTKRQHAEVSINHGLAVQQTCHHLNMILTMTLAMS